MRFKMNHQYLYWRMIWIMKCRIKTLKTKNRRYRIMSIPIQIIASAIGNMMQQDKGIKIKIDITGDTAIGLETEIDARIEIEIEIEIDTGMIEEEIMIDIDEIVIVIGMITVITDIEQDIEIETGVGIEMIGMTEITEADHEKAAEQGVDHQVMIGCDIQLFQMTNHI